MERDAGGGLFAAGGADAGGSGLPSRLADPAIAAALFVAALAYFGFGLHLTFDLRDEGFFLYNTLRVARGEIPHRDFVDAYGPGTHLLNAQLFRLFGVEIMPVRLLLAAVRASAVALSYLIARRLAPRPFAVLAALMATAYWGRVIWNLNSPYPALYTIPLCMLALLLLLGGRSGTPGRYYLLAGFASGAALLFKQSLAVVAAYGIVLAIVASGMLEQSARDGRWRLPVLLAWAVAGLAVALPFAAGLGATDYLLHFLPIHALLLVVGVHFARFGDATSLLARVTPRLALYGAGLLVVPTTVAAVYATWGALDELAFNMFWRPFQFPNYYVPVELPPFHSIALLASVAALATAGLLLLRGARLAALGLAVPGALLAAVAIRATGSALQLGIAVDRASGVLPALTAYAGLALLVAPLGRRSGVEPVQRTLVAVLLFQQMMVFQIFPRAGFNYTMMLGTLTPVLAYLCFRWWQAAGVAGRARAPQRAAAFALVSLFPVSLVAYIVADAVWQPRPGELAWTAMRFPATRGIRLSPAEYRLHEVRVVEWLVDHIRAAEPADAPVFLLTNDRMLLLLSDRESLFPDHTFVLYGVGWDIVAAPDRDRLDAEELIQRLEREPDPIVVDRDDFSVDNFRAYLPDVARYVDDNFRVEYRIGTFRVLRKGRPG